MKLILKQVVIAAGLVAVCVLVLAATRTYGVWVISAIAVVLVLLGLLRKDRSPDQTGKADEAPVKPSEDANGHGEARK